jgi:hypothetical protein
MRLIQKLQETEPIAIIAKDALPGITPGRKDDRSRPQIPP